MARVVACFSGGVNRAGQEDYVADKPNILVIWGDDIGITNISAYSQGLMGYRTPNIDRIAAEGEGADVPAMHGWRRQVFGDIAAKLVRGEIALKFDRRKVSVFEVGRPA